MSVNEKMTSIASGLRTLSATTDKMGLDSMSEHIAQANETVNGQTVLIREIKKALVNKSANSGDVADYNQGYDDGFAAGKTEGSNEGYNQGKTDGYQEGRDSIKLYNETITESGTYTVEPKDGFDGFSSVLVDVADRYDEGKADGITEGVASVKIQPEKTTDTNGTVEPDSPYVALKKVIVAVPDRYNDGVEAGKEIGRSEGYNEGKTDGIAEGKASIKLYDETITESGSYTVEPKEGFDGFSSVTVDVKDRYQEGYDKGSEDVKSNLYNLEANENKTYTPEEYNVDGFGSVTVAVPEREPVLEPLTATENKTYTVPETIDGYSSVVVQVPLQYDEGYEDGKADGIAEGVASIKIQSEKEAKENGTVEPDEGFYGLAKVIVAVPQKTEVDLEETIAENHKTFTYEPEDGETFKKVTISVNVPTEIEGEFNGVALLEEDRLAGEDVYYHIYDNGWAIIDGVGSINDCEGYNDDPLGIGQNTNPPSPFWNYSSITHIYIADGITYIGAGLFANCENIEYVRLPDTLEFIGLEAFCNTNISKIYIPSSVTYLGEGAFSDTLLSEIYYGGTNSEWENLRGFNDVGGALWTATLHCKYEIPEDIQGEFNGVALLESGECGESINYNIYDNGWVVLEGTGDTYDYEDVYDDENGEFLGYNSPFCNNALITHVYIADDITSVGTGLFADCSNIEEVRLPDGLCSIGVSAFENVGISKIYLPNSIMGIELDAFCDCSNLTDVYYNGTKDDWHSFWDGSDFGADAAIFDAGLADATLHCEYEEPITETWTFEMEDGSIVTKEVEVVC